MVQKKFRTNNYHLACPKHKTSTQPGKMDEGSHDNLLKLALSISGNGDVYDLLDEQDGPEKNNISADKVADVFSQPKPPNASDPESADRLLASQVAGLSVTDREKAYMDVHGIAQDVRETPELVSQSLLKLQEEIELLPDKRAYTIAEKLDSEYVQDRDFRLAFLRGELFDCQKAALRIIRHFQMKLDLFGMEKLAMDITQDDLDLEDMDALYSSTGRFLNACDSAGRIINFIFTAPEVYKTDAVLRRGFYNIVTAFRKNPERQLRGAVTVYSAFRPVQASSGANMDLNWKYAKLNEGSCMRISSMQLVCTDKSWEEMIAFLSTAINKPIQVRTRVFRGATVSECRDHLRGVGIDPESLPINEQGELTDLPDYKRKLEAQRKFERLNFPPRATFHVPFCLDVILGKGLPFQNHPGNKRLRDLVDLNAKRYKKAAKGEKKGIAQEIVDTIKQSGGYFLKQDGSKWIPVDNGVARVKVSATFRTQRWIAKS